MTATGIIDPEVVTSVNDETGDVELDAADIGADPAGAATTAVTAHSGATDPHGDRAFTTAQIGALDAADVGADPAGTAATAVAAHVGATDPHGDRAYADGIVGALTAADIGADPAGSAAAAVAAHVVAIDPHGDRAYSDGQLTTGLAGKIDEVNGEVVDSTLTVRKSDNSSGLRLRATGGAVDIDKMAGDIVVSSFAGPAFAGTQTALQRWRASGSTFAGLTNFGSTVYTDEQSIDAVGGTANLGAKNSASNLRFCGYLDIDNAPTSGTWALGDLVLTNAGQFRCIVAGTGTAATWRWIGRFAEREAGYAGWNFQPGDCVQSGTIVPTGGLSYVLRWRAVHHTVSALQLHLTTSPSGITNAWCSLHNDAGAVLGAGAKSSQRSGDFGSGGMKTMPLDVQQGVTPGAFYRWRFWFTTSSTLPTMSRATNSASAIINPGQPASGAASTPFRWASADSGLTDMASAPDQIGTLTGILTAWWAGATP